MSIHNLSTSSAFQKTKQSLRISVNGEPVKLKGLNESQIYSKLESLGLDRKSIDQLLGKGDFSSDPNAMVIESTSIVEHKLNDSISQTPMNSTERVMWEEKLGQALKKQGAIAETAVNAHRPKRKSNHLIPVLAIFIVGAAIYLRYFAG